MILGIGLIIVNIYRIPEQTKAHVGICLFKRDVLLTHLKKKKIVICGDFQSNDILIQNFATENPLKSLVSSKTIILAPIYLLRYGQTRALTNKLVTSKPQMLKFVTWVSQVMKLRQL